ncbi:helix-turn-helix domain-containing protein [Virgibacillus flavescens]|uniref:helix-turn-helix domain-containing protein n=1 Tax=Virgibacillus flavescens TaxID=1611422 RepID=UPI003D349C80
MAENSFGEIVKRERKKKGMSLAKVAEAVTNIDDDHKINPSYINRLEKGKQSNPSFIIVAMLSSVLGLDMREVFKAFGFEQLIEDFDSGAEFTLGNLLRLHTIKHDEIDNDVETPRRYLNNNEKEALVNLLSAVFNYSLEKNSPPIDKLTSVIEELDKLRNVQQQVLKEDSAFNVKCMSVTFTIEQGSLLRQEGINLDEWKEKVKEAIEEEFNKLMDYPNGILIMTIDKEKWLIQKKKYQITILSKQPVVVEL